MQFNQFARSTVAAAALSMLAGSAFAEASATATAQSHSTVMASIGVAKSSDLDFGNIVRPSAAGGSGVVTMAYNSTTVAAQSPVTTLGGTVSHAAFAVNGEPNKTFSISVPASFNLTSNATGATPIAVSLVTPLASASLDATGAASVPVGGSFTVTGGTTTGAYAGSFDLTVQYN